MIKDLNDTDKMLVTLMIKKYVDQAESDKALTDYYEKAKMAYDRTINFLESQVNLDDATRQEIQETIKDSLYQSDAIADVFEDDYQPWLEDAKTDIDWNHRDDYYFYLSSFKQWQNSIVYDSIDKTTDIILDHMGDPRQENDFIKKGLVIGEVQSGKTANYTGLINKSIDAGYKFIIILAGQQNDLRDQTQRRLDKEVLGFDTSNMRAGVNVTPVGVGKIPGHNMDVVSLTAAGNEGDFRFIRLTHILDKDSKPLIAVVKKNTTVLKNLASYIKSNLKLAGTNKLQIPVLIIDDEVDQASVNTKKNPDDDPTRINGRIREIINLCAKVSYVGYTATPYANVLIRSNVENDTFGDDLFPKDFIVVLPVPENYCGVDEFFGSDVDIDSDLVVEVTDTDELGTQSEDDEDEFKLKSYDEIKQLSGSLKNAVDDFIVGSAVRRSRGEITHNGMMVHVAAFKKPANSLKGLLNDYVIQLKQEIRFDHDRAMDRYYQVWEDRFEDVSLRRYHSDNWDKIEVQIPKVIELLKVKLLNGDSKDVIDYSTSNQSQIIAVGGNKLSRGITLEGLMTTYYLRDPRAYDTAMQMGRWFGYKESYIDLCRIYSQKELIANFVRILDASKALREDISAMNDKNLTPLQFGMKIRANPNLLPTARNKMYGSEKMHITFSQERQETIHLDLKEKDHNKKAVDNFISGLDADSSVEYKEEKQPVYRNVKVDQVLEFLNDFIDTNDIIASKTDKWVNYIEKMSKDGELINWTVTISNIQKGNEMRIGSHTIRKSRHKINGDYVRAISNPSDFKYLFTDNKRREKYKNGFKKGDPELKDDFTKDKALLAIYPFDIIDSKNGNILEDNVIGLAIWFPETNNKNAFVLCYVNDVFVRNGGEAQNEE